MIVLHLDMRIIIRVSNWEFTSNNCKMFLGILHLILVVRKFCKMFIHARYFSFQMKQYLEHLRCKAKDFKVSLIHSHKRYVVCILIYLDARRRVYNVHVCFYFSTINEKWNHSN